MRWALLVIGILCVLTGGVWILQGAHVLTQGFMAGQSRWTRIGAVVAAAGIVLVIVGATRRKGHHSPS